MKFFQWFFSSVLLSLALSGCQKGVPEPELLDPIFKDLSETHRQKAHELEEELKKLAQTKAQLEKTESRSVQRKILAKDYSIGIQTIQELRESILYYKIRAERRKFTDRMTYKVALDAGKPWPDPQEYAQYQVNKRLNEASRQWAERVPKLNDRYPALHKKKEKKAGGSGEGGEPAEPAPAEH